MAHYDDVIDDAGREGSPHVRPSIFLHAPPVQEHEAEKPDKPLPVIETQDFGEAMGVAPKPAPENAPQGDLIVPMVISQESIEAIAQLTNQFAYTTPPVTEGWPHGQYLMAFAFGVASFLYRDRVDAITTALLFITLALLLAMMGWRLKANKEKG